MRRVEFRGPYLEWEKADQRKTSFIWICPPKGYKKTYLSFKLRWVVKQSKSVVEVRIQERLAEIHLSVFLADKLSHFLVIKIWWWWCEPRWIVLDTKTTWLGCTAFGRIRTLQRGRIQLRLCPKILAYCPFDQFHFHPVLQKVLAKPRPWSNRRSY